jgi:hypothetical protein
MLRLMLLGLAALMGGPESLHAETYLASIASLRLRDDEAVERFAVRTWGVQFKALCRIPADWEITAGSFGPGGRIEGEAGHGATMLREPLAELRDLVLIELSGHVQGESRGDVPPTFSGEISVFAGQEGRTRIVPVTSANIHLVQASACPSAG